MSHEGLSGKVGGIPSQSLVYPGKWSQIFLFEVIIYFCPSNKKHPLHKTLEAQSSHSLLLCGRRSYESGSRSIWVLSSEMVSEACEWAGIGRLSKGWESLSIGKGEDSIRIPGRGTWGVEGYNSALMSNSNQKFLGVGQWVNQSRWWGSKSSLALWPYASPFFVSVP